jgi:hypothetical protein
MVSRRGWPSGAEKPFLGIHIKPENAYKRGAQQRLPT